MYQLKDNHRVDASYSFPSLSIYVEDLKGPVLQASGHEGVNSDRLQPSPPLFYFKVPFSHIL
jgi:hypothetical protein